ncbi:murein biosynthesis integral membrane protein MurJ [Zobellia sp. 1_MG-2023]|uniref:murein biosynthesis integral membrane protein MurJ n=1 Tax=Zobellia sp. 1_MG-2023 TaxID=3062626 RepID=UPI0026E365E0|nr:lipid II flippase MurJ [Zobellia sp. 1_MG-2023]MDO6819743.1 lipid II flippase MurJ [Zobellia sp. 1_MG-2023]
MFSYLKGLASQPLFANLMSVGLMTLVVKGFGFYKDTIVASTFGLSSVLLDTFFIAILIPNFVQNVFVGALKNLFIPNYLVELKTSNHKGEFQSVSFLIITAIVIILTLICIIFAEFYLEQVFTGHEASYYELIRNQLYIILPCLLFWGYSSLFGGLLEINEKFIVSSLTPVLTTIVTIICLLYFREQLGDMVMAYGMFLGTIVSFGYLLYFTNRSNAIFLKKPKLNENIVIMLKQLPAKITSGFLTGINSFVDKFFAAQLVVGSITAINYGLKIPAFVVGILIIALGNVLLPHFSKLIATDLGKAYNQLFKILRIVFIGSLIVSVISIFLSNQIVSLLFERNEFTASDTIIVADIQKIMLMYIPFYLCTLVMVKFLTSINQNSFMAWTSLWNLLLNLVLDYILVEEYKVYGLVMSTTIVYIISSFFYFTYTFKQYKKFKLSL